MVYKLNPLVVRLDFERRMYRLDDTIKASVTLVPNGSVTVRCASLNLMVQTRHTEVRMGKRISVFQSTPKDQIHMGSGIWS